MATYQYEEGSYVEIDKLDMDPYVSNYYNIVAGNVYKDPEGKAKEGIVIDTSIGGGDASYSNIIVMEDGKLKSVFGGNQDTTFKDLPVKSGDVNNDGIIEIGSVEPPIGWNYFKPDEIRTSSYIRSGTANKD